MIRQGAVDTIIGAIPIAVSQFQPRPRPAPVTASPATPRTRQSLIHVRSRPPDGCIAEGGAQHDPDIALGTSPVPVAAEAGGFVMSKLSMIFILLWSTDQRVKTSSQPRENREGLEQPIGKARQLARHNGPPIAATIAPAPKCSRRPTRPKTLSRIIRLSVKTAAARKGSANPSE